MFRAATVASALLWLVAFACTGCYSPGGGWSHTGGPQVYPSSERSPKTVRLIDTRTEEVVFSIDIPPQKQLVMQFQAGKGDDTVYTPDLLLWDVMDKGKLTGKLRNSLTVPNAAARLLEMEVRPGIEYAQADPQDVLRTDDAGDRPDWWSSEGGQVPDEQPETGYDD